MSGTPIASDYIYSEANAGRMGARLMAIVAEGDRGRVYLAPTPEMEAIALKAQPNMEIRTSRCRTMPSLVFAAALRAEDLWRPLHPAPARGADDLLRPGAAKRASG